MVHADDNTFVRSFAYATGPAYGLLLDEFMRGWHQRLSKGTRLDLLLQAALRINLRVNLQGTVLERAQEYGGSALLAAENEREGQRQRADAGLTRGGFYAYFKSKSDLYIEVLGCFFTDPKWKNRWEGINIDPASPEAGAQIVRAYLSSQHFDDVDNSCQWWHSRTT